MASNYLKKELSVKNAEGARVKRFIDVIPEILTDTHTISATTGNKITFFVSKELSGHKKNHTPGTQNLFKQNTGFVKELHLRVFDTLGIPLYDKITAGGILPDRLRRFQESVADAIINHKLGEFEILKDEFYGYVKPFPNLLTTERVAGEPVHTLEYGMEKTINLLSKSKEKGLGYKYPGPGQKIIKNDIFTIEIELKKPFDSLCYGMQIQSLIVGDRATDGAV
jgi:hypothetical protein